VRPSRVGWSVPLGVAGLVWALLPVVNALTTHTHLGITLPAGEWVWASMDLAFLTTGLLLGWLSWRLRPGRVTNGKAAAAKAPRTPPAAASPAAPDVSVSTSGA
nr:PepSY domain-containing protein [Acidovorax sp.]